MVAKLRATIDGSTLPVANFVLTYLGVTHLVSLLTSVETGSALSISST